MYDYSNKAIIIEALQEYLPLKNNKISNIRIINAYYM